MRNRPPVQIIPMTFGLCKGEFWLHFNAIRYPSHERLILKRNEQEIFSVELLLRGPLHQFMQY